MAGLLNDVSMMGLKGSRNVDTTKRTVYNNNPMAVSLRNSSGNVIPYNGLLGVQGEYEKSLTDTMGQYIDPAHGLRAGIRNLRIQAKNLGDEKSLYDLIARWHGKNQGEQKTADYASMIAKSMGDSRNPKDIKIGDIDFNDSAVKSKIINPIISWEGGGASLPQHIIDMAIDMEQPKQEQRPQMQPQVGLPPQFAMENIGNIDPQRMPPQQQMPLQQLNKQYPFATRQMLEDYHLSGLRADSPQQPTLQQQAQTAQTQPALDPFPWLRETYDRRSKVGMYPEKKRFKGASMYPPKKMLKSRSMYPSPKK